MERIIQLIHENQSFILTGHTSPDGDAIGASLGLGMALKKIGKDVTVLLENIPNRYRYLPGQTLICTKNFDALDCDVFIALDCADDARIPDDVKPILKKAKHTVCIDHHMTNNGFADVNYIDANASSTSEMVYGIINSLTPPDYDIAVALYTGIVFDTGGFRFSKTNPTTLHAAAELLRTGIDFTSVYTSVLHAHSFEAGKALGIVLGNMVRTMQHKIVYSFITKEEMTSANVTRDDLEGIVQYLMTTDDAQAACFVYETEHAFRVSLRSIGPNVGAVAEMFGGGGHELAAGCEIKPDGKQVLAIIQALMQAVADFENKGTY